MNDMTDEERLKIAVLLKQHSKEKGNARMGWASKEIIGRRGTLWDFEKIVGNSAACSYKRLAWTEGSELIAICWINVEKVSVTNAEATARGGHNESSFSSVCISWVRAPEKVTRKSIVIG